MLGSRGRCQRARQYPLEHVDISAADLRDAADSAGVTANQRHRRNSLLVPADCVSQRRGSNLCHCAKAQMGKFQ
jgi:hypothetical protein